MTSPDPAAPTVFVFDVFGTVLDPSTVVDVAAPALGTRGEIVARLWRQKQLEYSWVSALIGRRTDFRTLTEEALDWSMAVAGINDAELRSTLLEAYSRLRAFSDVAPTLKALRAAGATIALFSNGTPEMIGEPIERNGLTPLIDHVVSVQPSGTFKPKAEVYSRLCEALGVCRRSVSFQSANRWDVAGGKNFGFWSVWLNRTSAPDEYAQLPPDRTIRSLSELDTSGGGNHS